MSKPIPISISVCCLLTFVILVLPVQAERGIVVDSSQGARVALVIGNADYVSSPLQNPVNDARDMADVLRALDFEVIEKLNANKRAMVQAMNRFGRKLHKSEVGIFYYAGHGMQISGRNFLIPVGAVVKSESDVEFEAVHAGRVLGKMEEAGNKLNIVILDACRDNPFKRSFRTNKQGLAQMDAPIGSIIAYATSPGATAADGRGRNGIYTKHLLANLKRSNLPVQEIFMETGLEVMQETNNQQVPWISSTPVRKYFLAGGSDVPPTPSRVKTGSLLVWTEPEGAVVYLEGTRQGEAPVKVSGLKPDSYRMEARKEGFVAASRTVRVRAGATAEATLRLEPALEVGRLYVNPTPSDARVRIMNIVPKYEDGIELKPGEYHVRLDKPGYKTKDQWVDLKAGEKLDVALELKELPSTGRLTVRTTPSDAKVRLLNSDQGYRDGMELEDGRYRIEVSKSDYETARQWVSLSSGQEQQVTIRLESVYSRYGTIVKKENGFYKFSSGAILDKSTYLIWYLYIGRKKVIDWYDSKDWVSRLSVCGGGWRMPSGDELEQLCENGIGETSLLPKNYKYYNYKYYWSNYKNQNTAGIYEGTAYTHLIGKDCQGKGWWVDCGNPRDRKPLPIAVKHR